MNPFVTLGVFVFLRKTRQPAPDFFAVIDILIPELPSEMRFLIEDHEQVVHGPHQHRIKH